MLDGLLKIFKGSQAAAGQSLLLDELPQSLDQV
jgi:hypothetical protein